MSDSGPDKSSMHALALGALGVVYGDIGTSPLYALRESLNAYSLTPTPDNILGILSLIFWIIFAVVSVKYVTFVMRADNHGEGGILALLALMLQKKDLSAGKRRMVIVIALIGAALFLGDGLITPAISVLSAVEGLEVAAPAFGGFVIPIALIVLITLFSFQRQGTDTIGKLFGPIMLIWFSVLAITGLAQIVAIPEVLAAINPAYAFGFFLAHPVGALITLGAVVLAVTGVEALYADMGHFGKRPIRAGWFYLVMPALLLNYFGQGALLLTTPEALVNPFFLMQPEWARLPMVGLATIATVIASQAVISGAFSLCHQALQLGYLPRTEVRHTSASERGQIYLPTVNWGLLVGVVWLVLEFKSSHALASAYGLAVTGTMLIDTLLMYFITRYIWHWSAAKTFGIVGVFLVIDTLLFSATLPKVVEGGWFPLVIGAAVFTAMSTWKWGRSRIYRKLAPNRINMKDFLQSLRPESVHRALGNAVFLAAPGEEVPHALLHNLKHNQVIHERVIILTIMVADTPRIETAKRYEIKDYGDNFCHVTAHVGYMEYADVPRLLADEAVISPPCEMMETSYFLSRLRVVPKDEPGLATWRIRLFSIMVRNAAHATDFFKIPPNRVVEFDLRVNM